MYVIYIHIIHLIPENHESVGLVFMQVPAALAVHRLVILWYENGKVNLFVYCAWQCYKSRGLNNPT